LRESDQKHFAKAKNGRRRVSLELWKFSVEKKRTLVLGIPGKGC